MSLTFIYPIFSRKTPRLLRLNISIFLLLFIYSSNCYSQTLSSVQIYKKVSPAVVVIHAYDENDKLSTQGSGVVINAKGYVVTNYHVLSGNKRIEILHGKEIIPFVDIIGIDVEKDILILKIEAKKFSSIKIGDSKSLNIGQRIYAIGSPMGLENSISEGIISGLRNYNELNRNFIQLTASISPGSSGGAVVNDKGELIGISTLTFKQGQNLNFAIPIEDILKVKNSSYSKNEEYKYFELLEKGRHVCLTKDECNESIKCLSIYLEKYPNDAFAYYLRGSAKCLSDERGAIQDYNRAIELNPNYAEAYNNRGITKSNLKDYRGAIQDYNKTIELNPDDPSPYINRGRAKSDIEDYQGAIQDCSKAIELSNYGYAYEIRAYVRVILKDYRGAIQDYNKEIEINPNNADVYLKRGVAKVKLEDYRGAIQDYNKAIILDPNNEITYLKRGVAKFFMGDKDGACLDWSKAGELGSADAYDNIKEICNKN